MSDIVMLMPHYYAFMQSSKYINFEMPKKAKKIDHLNAKGPNVYFIIPDAMPALHRVQETFFQDYEYETISEFNDFPMILQDFAAKNPDIIKNPP